MAILLATWQRMDLCGCFQICVQGEDGSPQQRLLAPNVPDLSKWRSPHLAWTFLLFSVCVALEVPLTVLDDESISIGFAVAQACGSLLCTFLLFIWRCELRNSPGLAFSHRTCWALPLWLSYFLLVICTLSLLPQQPDAKSVVHFFGEMYVYGLLLDVQHIVTVFVVNREFMKNESSNSNLYFAAATILVLLLSPTVVFVHALFHPFPVSQLAVAGKLFAKGVLFVQVHCAIVRGCEQKESPLSPSIQPVDP